MKTVLGFLGPSDIEVMRIEGVALAAETEPGAFTKAPDAVAALAVADWPLKSWQAGERSDPGESRPAVSGSSNNLTDQRADSVSLEMA